MKKKSNVIGLRPVPPDAVIEVFLDETISEDDSILQGQLEQLAETVMEGMDKGQPYNFAYGKMLNFLASKELTKVELVHLCAAAMWKLNEESNGKTKVDSSGS